MLKEVIVVEGRDDLSAVKRAVDTDVIVTGGFRLSKETIQLIRTAQKKRGVIVLTDPDHAGEMIRKKISSLVKGVRHAFIPRDEATLNGDIGVENASPESIIKALERARVRRVDRKEVFTMEDMIDAGLVGNHCAAVRRAKVGCILGIGYANASQFLKRLNMYDISREEFMKALDHIN
ncbi:ribonuclease M5 [Caldanaerobius polysaccharolyticus]|uniref:ribonuclease M5 n=1 Tax=Caldanaerobius polysaccharolyticus TaxID=44256 RepID=UPI00047D0BBE|nr:ribonuclease M5 [Caldanaerobius polysaccharolyticus]